jgi:hypothetical protein
MNLLATTVHSGFDAIPLVLRLRFHDTCVKQGNSLAMASPRIDKADRFVFAEPGSDFDYMYEHDLAHDDTKLQSMCIFVGHHFVCFVDGNAV